MMLHHCRSLLKGYLMYSVELCYVQLSVLQKEKQKVNPFSVDKEGDLDREI